MCVSFIPNSYFQTFFKSLKFQTEFEKFENLGFQGNHKTWACSRLSPRLILTLSFFFLLVDFIFPSLATIYIYIYIHTYAMLALQGFLRFVQ